MNTDAAARERFVLAHSPLIGPMSWSAVAAQLRQRHFEVLAPALPRPLDTPEPVLATPGQRRRR